MNTFIRRLTSDIPLLRAETLLAITGANISAIDIQLAEHPVMKKVREQLAVKPEIRDGIAVIPMVGTLAHRPDPFEMAFLDIEDSRSVAKAITQAGRNPDVSGILLSCDSPGGMTTGGAEMCDAVLLARKFKPVVAHATGECASLAYMVASQATEIVANKSAVVGSIGAIASIVDYSAMLAQMGIRYEHITNKDAKYKAAGAVGTSLNPEQRDYIQARVESAFSMFKSYVLSARPEVKPEAMQGQVFRGAESKSVGLVDRVGDEEFALGVLRSHIRK